MQQSADLVAPEIGKIQELLHAGKSANVSRSMSTCSSCRMNGGSSRTIFGSVAVPARMPAFQQLRLDLLRRAGRAQPGQKAGALMPRDGTHYARLPDVTTHTADALEKILRLNRVDDRLNHRAGHRTTAERRTQQVEFEC